MLPFRAGVGPRRFLTRSAPSMAIWLTLAVLALAVYLFISEKLRVDIVALLILASLVVLGLVSPSQSLAGFSSEATITVAAMFVLSAGISRSGLLQGFGRALSRLRRPWLSVAAVLLVAGPVSAFINNTAAVAVLIPVLLAASAALRRSPSKTLIPLSYVVQMGGVCTLIGTSTNLLVNSMAVEAGQPGFGLFEFSELGLHFLVVGLVYLLVVGPFLLPDRPAPTLKEPERALGKYVTELRVQADSPLLGKPIADSRPVDRFQVYVIALVREGEHVWTPRTIEVSEGDVLIVQGEWAKLSAFAKANGLALRAESAAREREVLIEAMVAPNGRLAGHTLDEVLLPRQHDARVLGIHRRGEIVREQLGSVKLAPGDLVLFALPESEVSALRADPALIVVAQRDVERIDARRALTASAILVGVVTVAGFGWLPIPVSAIIGCIALVFTRCLDPDEAYESIDWRVIMLLGGIFPLGIAMQESGLAALIVDSTLIPLGGYGPLVVLGALYVGTAMLTEVMSNNASAVLLTPIAIGTAAVLGVDAKPFLIAVMFAASTAFATPIGYQTNTMVYSAGGYRFADFLRIGLPLNLVFAVLAVLLIPRYFPFDA